MPFGIFEVQEYRIHRREKAKTHRELFNTILAQEGLKTDREAQPRTAYSLRPPLSAYARWKGRTDRQELPHER